MYDQITHAHFTLKTNEINAILKLAREAHVDIHNLADLNRYLIGVYESLTQYCRKYKLTPHFSLLEATNQALWLVFYFFRHKSVYPPRSHQLSLPWPQHAVTDRVQAGEASRFETLLLIELMASQLHQVNRRRKIDLVLLQKILKVLLPHKTETIVQERVDFVDLAQKIPESIVLRKVKKLVIQSQGREYQMADSMGSFSRLDQFIIQDNANQYANLLPPSLFQHKKITEITIRQCQLTELPYPFHSKRLVGLYLPQNKLTQVPKHLFEITQLQNLDLAENQLTALPPQFGQLENLHQLDLSGNAITAFPTILAKMPGLEDINLQRNDLSELSPDMIIAARSKKVDLRDNWMHTLPNEIAQLPKRHQWLFVGNPLEQLPDHLCPFIIQEIRKVSNAKSSPRTLTGLFCWANFHPQTTLRQAANQKLTKLITQKDHELMLKKWSYDAAPNKTKLFKFVYRFGTLLELDWPLLHYWVKCLHPKEVFHIDLSNLGLENMALEVLQVWPKLRSLRLSQNPLQRVGTGITQLSNLQKLYLDNASLAKNHKDLYDYALPLEISHLEKLTRLDLQDNHLQSLPPGIGLMDSLKELNLRENHFETFSVELCELDTLEKLDLRRNMLRYLPKDIEALTRLKSLNISHNDFHTFPVELCELAALEVLDMSENTLRDLPEGIHKLTQLKELNLNYNRFKSLSSLPAQLEILKVSVNRLETFLESHHFNLPHLKALYLDHNQLDSLPNGIANSTQLELLDISYNQFSVFPEHILNLTNLKVIKVYQNPFVEIPEEIKMLTHLKELWISREQNDPLLKTWLSKGVDIIEFF